MENLIKIQSELKAPKNQKNTFGGYNYRSCEDILEAVKPLLKQYNCLLTITDELVNIGERYYIKATATIKDETSSMTVSGFAREEETKKGMDASQITGACSSYARKYALNGLFLIDDNKDSDATNKHGKDEPEIKKAENLTDKSKTAKMPLKDSMLKKAIERIEQEDYAVFQKTLDAFDVTEDQKKQLQAAIDRTMKQPEYLSEMSKSKRDNELFEARKFTETEEMYNKFETEYFLNNKNK